MSVDNNGKQPGGVTGRGFRPGQSGNPNGVSKRVVELRKAIREGLLPAAMRHGALVLGAVPPEDMTDAERLFYADVTPKDRTAVMDVVFAYSLPKPKQATRLEHAGADNKPLSISIDLGAGQ